MLDERVLVFPEPAERSTGEAVLFRGRDGDKRVPCGISRETLEDHFDSDNRDLLKVFRENRERIEHEARRKYLAGLLEANGSVLIKSMDL